MQNLLTKMFGALLKKVDNPEVSTPVVVKEVKEEIPETRKKSSVFGVSHKLNSDQVMKVLYWLATFVSVREIVEKVKEEFGVSISASGINYYAYQNEDYKNTILKIREKWGNELMDIELSHKRRRIQEIEKIYHTCVETKQMKNALGAIYQIQGEVEKATSIGTQINTQYNIFKDMTEQELEEERIKSLERIKVLKQIPEIKAEEVEDVR